MDCFLMQQQIVQYVQQHYHEPDMCAAGIAQHFGYSVNYLRILFKQQSGITLARYINGVRMENAKKLLAGTCDANVRIARRVGYENYSSFAGAFRKTTGMTPWDYREVRGYKRESGRIAERIYGYINDNYCRPGLTVEEVAEHAGYSVNYTRSIFKNHGGISISKYIEKKRIERARELLTGTGLTNARIAEAVGYGNCASFVESFKRSMGMTPFRYKCACAENRTNNIAGSSGM